MNIGGSTAEASVPPTRLRRVDWIGGRSSQQASAGWPVCWRYWRRSPQGEHAAEDGRDEQRRRGDGHAGDQDQQHVLGVDRLVERQLGGVVGDDGVGAEQERLAGDEHARAAAEQVVLVLDLAAVDAVQVEPPGVGRRQAGRGGHGRRFGDVPVGAGADRHGAQCRAVIARHKTCWRAVPALHRSRRRPALGAPAGRGPQVVAAGRTVTPGRSESSPVSAGRPRPTAGQEGGGRQHDGPGWDEQFPMAVHLGIPTVGEARVAPAPIAVEV